MVSVDVIVVHFPEQLFNEAKLHRLRAIQYDRREFVFRRWHAVWQTNILCVTAVEAWVNSIGIEVVQASKRKIRTLNFEAKLSQWTKGELSSNSPVVQRFRRVREYRNSLIHFKGLPPYTEVYDEGTLQRAEEAIMASRELMTALCAALDLGVPPWISGPYRRVR